MSLDPTRAAFVQKDYRYKTAEDLSVKANYPHAKEVTLNTQLDEASATSMATDLLDDLKVGKSVISLEVAEVISSDTLTGELTRYSATFPEFGISGKTVKVVSIETDFLHQRTKMVVQS